MPRRAVIHVVYHSKLLVSVLITPIAGLSAGRLEYYI